ncbi:hypothetical protein F5Y15DRAFT_254991 [Xylariaceae sp. FL0016]|nr:hypothetical protein F5Y15DRAFT_254991 [Xylariaceae sp. FL0016]
MLRRGWVQSVAQSQALPYRTYLISGYVVQVKRALLATKVDRPCISWLSWLCFTLIIRWHSHTRYSLANFSLLSIAVSLGGFLDANKASEWAFLPPNSRILLLALTTPQSLPSLHIGAPTGDQSKRPRLSSNVENIDPITTAFSSELGVPCVLGITVISVSL